MAKRRPRRKKKAPHKADYGRVHLYDGEQGDAIYNRIARSENNRNYLECVPRSHQGFALSPVMISKLAAALRTNTNLLGLALTGSEVPVDGRKSFFETLFSLQTLKTLDLTSASLGDDGIQELTTTIVDQHSTLKDLYLGSNTISSTGAKFLAELLRTNQSLTRINLDSNPLGDEGLVKLSLALRENKILRELVLDRIGCSDVGAVALAQALKQPHSQSQLRVLSFDRNRGLERTGVDALVEMLRENVHLCSLDIDKELTRQWNRRNNPFTFFTALNRNGNRAKLLSKGYAPSDWVDVIATHTHHLSAVFYLVRANPALCKLAHTGDEEESGPDPSKSATARDKPNKDSTIAELQEQLACKSCEVDAARKQIAEKDSQLATKDSQIAALQRRLDESSPKKKRKTGGNS